MDWESFIHKEQEEDYFKKLDQTVKYQRSLITIFPEKENVFAIFECCPLDKIKVVILGMDPYHSSESINKEIIPHAYGVAFGINKENNKIPPSLKNIMKVSGTKDQTLMNWVEQGVFLLNTVLTVKKGSAGSHSRLGWETFTGKAIELICEENPNTIFVLWGRTAQEHESLIKKHGCSILKSTHPSPFSANMKGTKAGDSFMEADHFNKINQILIKKGQEPINWN